MGFDDDDLYDEYGDPAGPADAWQHDELYDVPGDPIDRADDYGTDWSHATDPDDELLPSGYRRRQYKGADFQSRKEDFGSRGVRQPPPCPAAG